MSLLAALTFTMTAIARRFMADKMRRAIVETKFMTFAPHLGREFNWKKLAAARACRVSENHKNREKETWRTLQTLCSAI
jgi:hypothetical protein